MSQDKFVQAKEAFALFCDIIAQLRDPKTGCPWDLKQTHPSLAKYLIEEAYEAASVMQENDAHKICDELGDVLLQVVLNAQLAADEKSFTITDVIQAVHEKIVRRHPHVFGTDEDKTQRELPQIMKRWDEIKQSEKKEKSHESYMEQRGVQSVFPATTQAYKIGKLAHGVGFDWTHPDEVFDKLISELGELKSEWQKQRTPSVLSQIQNEIGDIYFTLAQLCRHLNWEPELVAHDGNKKFLRRFAQMETLIRADGKKLQDLKNSELEPYWIRVKQLEAL